MIDLTVTVGPLKLKNPVIAASGTVGYVQELKKLIDVNQLGGVITKTITLKPRLGNPPPRICETSAGVLNAIGLENPGLEHFCRHYLPALSRLKTVRVVSIAGETPNELAVIARQLNSRGIDALEVNLSCPNVKGKIIATSPLAIRTVIKKVRRATRLPLIIKLSPNITDIIPLARAAQQSGADIIALINTIKGLAIDWRTRKPALGNITGGLSGPAIKPIALRLVWEVAAELKIPVVGIGGIMTGTDALEFMVAGASAVQVGTAHLIDPSAGLKIIQQIKHLLQEANIKSVKEIINTLRV